MFAFRCFSRFFLFYLKTSTSRAHFLLASDKNLLPRSLYNKPSSSFSDHSSTHSRIFSEIPLFWPGQIGIFCRLPNITYLPIFHHRNLYSSQLLLFLTPVSLTHIQVDSGKRDGTRAQGSAKSAGSQSRRSKIRADRTTCERISRTRRFD